MNDERIKKIFSDEEFAKHLISLETPEEVRAALKEKGVDADVEEILKLRDVLVVTAQKEAKNVDELSLDDLDEVAGGAPPSVVMMRIV